MLDTGFCSPEEKASGSIGSCLNYAKYRIFCAIFKSAPVSALAITATLSYWEVLSDSPFLFAQENERLERKDTMENAFQLQGWNAEA